jgi:hypothetical protein
MVRGRATGKTAKGTNLLPFTPKNKVIPPGIPAMLQKFPDTKLGEWIWKKKCQPT